ncbi:hypothetical protein C7447_101361 [Tenacibaculum adriaticum]|uniref:GIY-YIG domain-containing protein n=1 Tax=Tenacibaculum adriaticum TaxID=413713 RepID=A0A5S5DUZ9_9FLAO|nr:hypothetical protein [Tenacibaculum adriaticum]TYP99757.1 hypothetical protein C7447_101361 [Tenacibaculum adriaticum]
MNIENFSFKLQQSWDELLPVLKKDSLKHFKKNTFKLEDSNFQNIPKKAGVYLFSIKPKNNFDLNFFKKQWIEDKTVNFPSIRKNISDYFIKDNWNVFYIGKSEKLQERILKHYNDSYKSSTYGLKLLERKWLVKIAEIRVSFYELSHNNSSKEVIQFIITNLEKELRKDLKPWVGKQ